MATIIHGKSRYAIAGKSTQRKQKTYEGEWSNDTPKHILKSYKNVTLFIDLMFVNGLPFMISTGKHLGFIQCMCLRTVQDSRLIETMQRFDAIYQLRDFKVKIIHADGQF